MAYSILVMADIIPDMYLAHYSGYLFRARVIGSMLGLVLGGLFSDYTSRIWAFYASFAFCALGLLIIPFAVDLRGRRSISMRKLRSMCWLSVVLSLVGMGCLLIGLSLGGTFYPWSSWRVLVPLCLGAGVVLLVGLYESIWATRSIFIAADIQCLPRAMMYLSSFLHGFSVRAPKSPLPCTSEANTHTTPAPLPPAQPPDVPDPNPTPHPDPIGPQPPHRHRSILTRPPLSLQMVLVAPPPHPPLDHPRRLGHRPPSLVCVHHPRHAHPAPSLGLYFPGYRDQSRSFDVWIPSLPSTPTTISQPLRTLEIRQHQHQQRRGAADRGLQGRYAAVLHPADVGHVYRGDGERDHRSGSGGAGDGRPKGSGYPGAGREGDPRR